MGWPPSLLLSWCIAAANLRSIRDAAPKITHLAPS